MRTKKLLIVATVVILISLFYTKETQAKTATVNTETLNLRKETSTSSTILEQLDRGEKLNIIEEDGDWLKVKVRGITGYVSKDYVKMDEDSEAEEKTNTEKANTSEENTQVDNSQTENTETESTTNTQVESEVTEKEENTKTDVEEKVTEGTLNKDAQILILPLINATKIEDAKNGAKLQIIDEVNGWYYVQTEKNSGWVRKNAITGETQKEQEETPNTEEPKNNNAENQNSKTEELEKTENEIEETEIEEKTMYVNYSSIFVRKGPGTNYGVADTLILNDSVTVIAESGDWYKVKTTSATGYIAKRLLSNSKQTVTSRSADEREETSTKTEEVSAKVEENVSVNNKTEETGAVVTSSKGQEIVEYAKQYLGCKYVYGGAGPSTFDCSGLTMYVYKHFGVNLPHGATSQSKSGTYVAKSDLQPGDIVFFKDYETMVGIGHCGIYIGDGNFIHASSGSGYCVKISTLLSGSYNTRYETARRYL